MFTAGNDLVAFGSWVGGITFVIPFGGYLAKKNRSALAGALFFCFRPLTKASFRRGQETKNRKLSLSVFLRGERGSGTF
jgi:hypothetical protein